MVARPQSVANLLKADSEDKSMLLVMQQDAVQVNPHWWASQGWNTGKNLTGTAFTRQQISSVGAWRSRVSIDKVEQQELLWLGSHSSIEADQGTPKENDVLMRLLQEQFEQLSAVDSGYRLRW